MALNIQVFKTRALTAVVFVAVMAAALLWNYWSFLIIFSIVHFGCWYEYQKLVGLIDSDYKNIPFVHKYGVMIAGWGFMLFLTSTTYKLGNLPLKAIGWYLLLLSGILLPLYIVFLAKPFKPKALVRSMLGLLYISLSWGLLIGIRSKGYVEMEGDLFNAGFITPLVLIASIWINDTMAYLVGSMIGKTPFSKISPKKTIEGTAGGAILCVAVVTLAGHYGFGIKSISYLVVISAIAAFIGTAGDLLESKLKRTAGVKDSGQFMPGHGGFLDRFDSLLLATPLAWLYLTLFYH